MRITDVFIDNHPLLEEFNAKMVAYPTVSMDLDNAVFQGVNRSSILLLHNYHTGQYMDCEIDFFGSVAERTKNRSALEALLVAPEPVKIDFGDGFFYRAVLQKISGVQNENEVYSEVSYRFRVTRHTDEIKFDLLNGETHMFCQSTVPLTDCRIFVPFSVVEGITGLVVRLGEMEWLYAMEITGNLLLDGIDKVFTMGGTNITNNNDFFWTDFPALTPGSNHISVATVSDDSPMGEILTPITIRYLPTYL